jgi:hypothetical protein
MINLERHPSLLPEQIIDATARYGTLELNYLTKTLGLDAMAAAVEEADIEASVFRNLEPAELDIITILDMTHPSMDTSLFKYYDELQKFLNRVRDGIGPLTGYDLSSVDSHGKVALSSMRTHRGQYADTMLSAFVSGDNVMIRKRTLSPRLGEIDDPITQHDHTQLAIAVIRISQLDEALLN